MYEIAKALFPENLDTNDLSEEKLSLALLPEKKFDALYNFGVTCKHYRKYFVIFLTMEDVESTSEYS